MPSCPYCLEEIKAGARKCPHCQTSLEVTPETTNTVYIVDKGLIKFAKFVGTVLTIFVLVGVYLFGFDIKETAKKTSEAEIEAKRALLEIERQRGALDLKTNEIEKKIVRIETLEREIAAHRDDTQRSAAEVKQLVLDIRGQKEIAGQIIVELRTLRPDESNVARASREEKGIAPERGKLWKNNSTLRIRFLDGSEEEKSLVRNAIKQWGEHVNLTFNEIRSGEAEIRISFKEDGSWSFIGTDALGLPQERATINYGIMAQLTGPGTKMQNALHEFGHAIGLAHEFQNPSAGDVFKRAAVESFYSSTYGWDKTTIERNVLAKAEYPGSRPYDPGSIMNYSFPAQLFMPGKQTKPGNTLSESDKRYVASLYPRG
jgi:hypothetical protein